MLVLLMLSIVGTAYGGGSTGIDLRGQNICNMHPDNMLRVDMHAYDINGVAVRMNAIDVNGNDLTACVISGSGTQASPYYREAIVDMDTDAEVSPCGMRTRIDGSGNMYYVWVLKAYPSLSTQTSFLSSFEITMECKKNDLGDGLAGSIIDFNIPRFSVEPLSAADITGPDSYATGASLKLVGIVYTDGRSTNTNLQDAQGIYFYNCYSATNSAMNQNRQETINGNGCSVSNSPFAPNGDTRQVSTSPEGQVKIEGSSFPAVLVDNKRTIYYTCLVGKCLTTNHPYCLNRCDAFRTGASSVNTVNTGIQYADSFTVQDQQAMSLFPSASNNNGLVLQTSRVGDAIQLNAVLAPNGIGAPASFADAQGFNLYPCQYSTSASFANPTTFINGSGCPVPNTALSPVNGFSPSGSSSTNRYVLTSGLINVQAINDYRMYVRCNVVKCTDGLHNFCSGDSCGAVNNNPSGVVNLGYVSLDGSDFTLSVTDPATTPALNIVVKNEQGEVRNSNSAAAPGENLSFTVEVTPGGIGGDGRFAAAKGVFLYNCFGSIDGQNREAFVDGNGCRIPGSRYATSQQCVAINDVAPFVIFCGDSQATSLGTIQRECNVSLCLLEDEPACNNPCSVTNPNGQANVQSGVATLTSSVLVEEEDLSRTAIRADEIRASIIAATVVAPVVLIAGVGIVTCLVIRSQMSGK